MEPKKVNDPDELGGWRINGRLGEGGFGTVFLAEKGAQKAAIKVIRQEFVEEVEARNRLATEAEVLSKLSDPSIGKILDSDLKGEIPWIATEFINGPTLADKIKYEGPLEEIAWFRLAANIFHAVISANQLGIIHKDIKPSNIILGETGNKLIDFGIAHISGQTRTMVFGDREGSTPYSSPEHFTIRANPKMDVFSTAATLAYAAKGESIWEGEDDLQLMRSINDDPPNLTGLSENQANYLLPLLEKNPSDRPSSIKAHQSALDFIEFLLGGSSKPTTLNKRRKTSRIKGKKARVAVRTLAVLASAILFISLLAGQFIPSEVKSWFTNTPSLTIAQLEKASSCTGLAYDADFQMASIVCRELAELGHAESQHALGFALDKMGNNQEALVWMRKAAEQKVPFALSWLAYDSIEKEEYSEALDLAKQSAELGELGGIMAVGLAYGYLGQNELAAEWYEKVWKLGDAWGLINLGYHYRFDDPNEIQAEKWLKLAATTQSKYESEGAFDYAEFLREQGKRSAEFCPWYKKSADAKYKEDEFDAVVSFIKHCSGVKPAPTPIDSPVVDSKLPTPVASKKPVTVSDSFKVSAPLANNVQIDEIFGRAFQSGFDWNIPLTNLKGEKVPEITAVQFRMIGYANAGWMDVPYKIKNNSTFGTVYAEVDDLLFGLLFKEVKYCPEFRAVREEGGKIVRIWNKGQPECASDYSP